MKYILIILLVIFLQSCISIKKTENTFPNGHTNKSINFSFKTIKKLFLYQRGIEADSLNVKHYKYRYFGRPYRCLDSPGRKVIKRYENGLLVKKEKTKRKKEDYIVIKKEKMKSFYLSDKRVVQEKERKHYKKYRLIVKNKLYDENGKLLEKNK